MSDILANNPQDGSPIELNVPSFDRADLFARMMDNEELVKVVMDAFMADAPALIQDIEQAGADNDAEALTMAAHSLKGAAANISAMELAEISSRIEMAARDSDLDTAAKLVPHVMPFFEKLKAAVGY